MNDGRVIVLGAGCAGLSAASRLQDRGFDVLLVESGGQVGGLAGGVRLGGNVFEYGPHLFHASDPEILAEVKDLLGADLIPFKRTVRIKFLGRHFQVPLSPAELIFGLPPALVLRAAASMAFHLTVGALFKPGVETSETVLRRFYGDVLYRIFFKDYMTRVWGVPPSALSPALARERLPALSAAKLIEKARGLVARKSAGRSGRTGTKGYVEDVGGTLFAVREGFPAIARRMADRFVAKGGRLRLETAARRLTHDGKRLTGVVVESKGRREPLPCRAVVSTLPINETALAFDPCLGSHVESSARGLRFRAIVFVGILARRQRVLPASFMYFREHSFNRITDLGYFGPRGIPEGKTLLVAEVTCDPEDRRWRDEALVRESVVADLVRESILDRNEIEELHVFRVRHGYPVYALGYERSLDALLAAFADFPNLETAGRQGRFQYVNSHVAMKMGREAADRLADRISAV